MNVRVKPQTEEFIIRLGNVVVGREPQLFAAIEKAYDFSVANPGQPVAVKRSGKDHPIFFRMDFG